MSLIASLKQKAEDDRVRAEAELPQIAERIAHGEATEKEVSAFVKSSGRSLDDVQRAVDRQLEIDRLRDLADQFRGKSLAAYRLGLEAAKHRKFKFKTIAELESETNRLRGLGWQVGLEAGASQEAHRQLAEMTGLPFPLPNLTEDYRLLDSEFADAVVAAVVVVVSEPVVSEPVVSEPTKPVSLPQRERGRQNAEPVELPSA